MLAGLCVKDGNVNSTPKASTVSIDGQEVTLRTVRSSNEKSTIIQYVFWLDGQLETMGCAFMTKGREPVMLCGDLLPSMEHVNKLADSTSANPPHIALAASR